MGILYFLVIFTPEKICGLLRFGLLIEDDQLVYLWVCHLFGVHGLYSFIRVLFVFICSACEVYHFSRSRHKDSNRYFSFCQKNSLILVCFLCFFSLSSRRDPFFLCLCQRESVFLIRWDTKGFASGMTKGKQYRIPYSNWIPPFAGMTETQKPWIASFFEGGRYYTRIFLITSPYRSFLAVVFFPFRRNPMIRSTNPKNPNQLSVESENVDDSSVPVVRSARLTPDSPEMVTTGATVVFFGSISSMNMRDITSILIPIAVITHLQSHFLTIPGSRSPRIRPIIGKT